MNRTSLPRFLEAYFRHRWLNLIPVFLMVVIAAAWLVLTKTQYTARGTIYVASNTLLASLASDQQNQTNQTAVGQGTAGEINSLLQTDAFIRSVIKQSALESEMSKGPRVVNDTILKVRESVWAQNVGQNLVVIGATYTSPVVAQQLSAAIMQGYIQWRVNKDSDSASAQAYFEKLIPLYQDALNSSRQDLATYLADHPDPVRGSRPTAEQIQIDRLQAAVQDASQRLNDAVSRAQSAQMAGTRATLNAQEAYSVIDTPTVPTEASSSRRKMLLNALLFVVVGLLLSVGAIVGASLLDNTLRFPADVRQRLDLPVLGAVPYAGDKPELKQEPLAQAAGQRLAAAQQA